MQIDPAGLIGYMKTIERNDSMVGLNNAQLNTQNPFADMVSNMIQMARSTGEGAEAEMAKVAAGQGDLVRTAASVNAAEVALETLVAVRDRAVTAYNDIIRMQI